VTDGLWYAGGAVCGLAQRQLQASAGIVPQIVVHIPALTTVSDVALDANGNAWAVGPGSNSVFRLPAAALAGSVGATPDLVIQSTALDSPGNLTFDASGALWVANRPMSATGAPPDGSIVRFDIPHGMSGMQNLAPTARFTSTKAGDLFEIGNIAFDAAQNLWVSSFAGLVRFDNPRSKSGDVAESPGAVIDKSGYKNDIFFYSVAFDAAGSLWASSGDGLLYLTSVSEFKDPGSLRGRSSPAAAATIKGTAEALPAGGLAFDANGNLWQANAGAILMYSAPQTLSGTVTPTPAITLTVTRQAAPTTNAHLMFFPRPIMQDAGTGAPDTGNGDSGTTDAPDAGIGDSGTDADAGIPNATGNFAVSNAVGTNASSMPISAPCCGVAVQTESDASSEVVLVFNGTGTSERNLDCELWGPLAVGTTYMLTNTGANTSNCKYREGIAGLGEGQWISSGGTLTVDSVTGKTFTFTLHAATMVANSGVVNNPAMGTFQLDGMGTVTLP
jgi:hypothetical protein